MHGDSRDQEVAGQNCQSTLGKHQPNTPKIKKKPDTMHRPENGYATGGKQIPPQTPCTYAADRILPLLEAFSKEIDGVKQGTDSEYIHRMRVSTRRIRAALHNFRICFSEKRYRKFNAETRNITRALGQARDADVQIAFLKKTRKRLVQARKGIPDEPRDPAVQARLEAIQYLITRLQRERDRYQNTVLQALEKFGRQNQPGAIRNEVLLFSPGDRHSLRKSPEFSTLAFLSVENIGRGMIELHSYAAWLQHQEAVTEHHTMRIAAKHLRYTMEIFAPVYRFGLKKYIAKVARLQKLLGDLHDTDVWIEMVSRILLKERSRPRNFSDPRRPGPGVLIGLDYFLKEREKERTKLFSRTVQYWSLLERTKFWDDLKREISHNRKTKYDLHREMPEEVRKALISPYAQIYPEGTGHSLQVVSLSLQLFDQLQPVYQLGHRERCLLEYGALLHDIGWKWGKVGHAKRSAHLIHSDEHLPLTVEERGAIGLLAVSHRGKSRFDRSGYFGLLSRDQQEVIYLLAGVLRVADGLDGLHRSRVRSLRCEVADDKVICRVLASSDCSDEVSMAKEKAEVLEQALGRPMQFVQDSYEQPVPDAG
jgi:CHAD domain-containing protein